MPSNYDKIRKDNIREYGKGKRHLSFLGRLYTKRTHFIFELLQNAEDAKASRILFRLFEDRLEVTHNGRPFNEHDVRGVCGVGEGTKAEDLTQIGKFGIGFKSVYAYTSTPEIHSGNESFAIKDYVRPYSVERRNVEDSWTTLFVFRFNAEGVDSETACQEIGECLRNLNPLTLLFLRKINKIRYELPDADGAYLRDESSWSPARQVAVIGRNNESENWLIFERPVTVPDKNNQVTVEIGYRIETNTQDKKESIVRIDRSPLVVYFPTEKDTRLGFLMQGPYRTTPARDNIHSGDDLNELLITETAELVVESLQRLKAMGLLSVSVLTALPIKFSDSHYIYRDGHYYGEFHSVFTRVREAFLNEDLIPANDGTFVSTRNAKLARGAALMKILNQDQLCALFQEDGEVKWLSHEITEDRTPGLRSYLIQELDVEEVSPEVFARNLSEQFLASQDDEWLTEFYKFLTEQKALWRPPRWKYDEGGILRTKPILRLQDGSHVNPFRNDGSPNAYLAVGPDTETSFQIVKVELSQNEEAYGFLKELGIPELDIVAEVIEKILPKYTDDSVMVESEDNKGDLKKIERAYKTDSQANKERLRKQLRKTPFILVECPNLGETGYRKPDQVYFATDDLRMYFCEDDSIAFVSSEYPDGVTPLFKELGISDRIRITCKSKPGSIEDVTLNYKGGYRRGLKGFDPDISVDGLEVALENPSDERSEIIWNKIAAPYSHCIKGEILISSRQDFSPHARTYEEKTTVSNFGELLRTSAWLPDSKGNMHKPCDLALDDLPESFVRDEKSADQLGMKKDVVAELAEACGVSETTLDRARQIEEASSEIQRKIDSLLAVGNERQPPFPESKSANPERRRKQVAKQYVKAPKKKYEKREGSDRTTRDSIEPTRQLRQQYTNDAKKMVCQICKEKMPFKKRDGEYYFEAVEALSNDYFPKEHPAQFLALCPVCAARYKEFIKRDKTAMKNLHHAMKNSDDLEVPLKLGELDTSIKFVGTHREDMKTILKELSQSDVKVLDRSDSWSEQDQRDLTTASLRYAETRYPEEEDLV